MSKTSVDRSLKEFCTNFGYCVDRYKDNTANYRDNTWLFNGKRSENALTKTKLLLWLLTGIIATVLYQAEPFTPARRSNSHLSVTLFS